MMSRNGLTFNLNNLNKNIMANNLIPEELNALIQQSLTDGVMEVSCLRYDGKEVESEFQFANGLYGWSGYLYHCKEKDWWEEITPDEEEDD